MIYQIKRNNIVIFEHEIRGSRTRSVPAIDYVDIEFDYYEAILLKKNDTIVFDNQTYYCDKQYNSDNKKASRLYTHRARFVSENYRATEIAVLDAQGVSDFEIEGNLLTLLTLAVTNLNRVSSGWSYEIPVPNTITRKFVISEENVMSFLVKVSGEFEIPFDITNKVIKFSEPTHVNAGNFAYGKGNGFLELTRTYKSGEKVPNTVYANGADDLQLDDPVVNVENINENGVIEGFYSNDNIVATTRVQMVGTVTANNVVPTNQINYNINAYKIAGQTPLINFETGALAGLSFYMTEFDYNGVGNTSLIYLKRRTIDGQLLPNDTVRAQAGDFFNITNITQPEEIVNEAKQKLFDYAFSYMQNNINKNLVVNASLDPLYEEDLQLNDKITIIDTNLDLNGDFVINEIKEDLQNLNKKDIKLDIVGFLGFNFNLPIKNENIIDLGIQNNYDDLVQVEEEIGRVKVGVDDIRTDTNILELEVSDIITVKLPSKESIINKAADLKDLNTDLYPNVQAVVDGLSETLNSANTYTNSAVQGKVYDATFVSSTGVLTLMRQDEPNIVIDLPTEELIKDIEIVTIGGVDYLRLTLADGSTKDVPLNSLLVGVVKKVNGLTPNSLGEIVLQITDIPGLSSELSAKVSKSGDTMSGNLTTPQLVTNVSPITLGVVPTNAGVKLWVGNGNSQYGISANDYSGGMDIMANQEIGGTIRFWGGTDNTNPTRLLTLNKTGHTSTRTISIPNGTANNHAVNLGQLASYVTQSSLNTQLANYVTLNGVQTISNTKTFTSSPIVPNGTLNGHAVNLGQLNTLLSSYATTTQLNSKADKSTTITINGVAQDLSTSRTWSIADTVTKVGTTSANVTSGDILIQGAGATSVSKSGNTITVNSTDTNTTYTAGNGISLTGTSFGQTLTTNGTGTFITSLTQTVNGIQANLGTPQMPTVGNGALTITVPTGLTISGGFTANQIGNSSFVFAYDTGYKGYTITEANKLAGIAEGAEVNVNADWNAISGDAQILNKPSVFPPSSHTHTIAQITDLQGTLDNKVSKAGDDMSGALRIITADNAGSTTNNLTYKLFLGNNGGLYGMKLGVFGNGNSFIQVGRNDNNTSYNLELNPLGGNVIVPNGTANNHAVNLGQLASYLPISSAPDIILNNKLSFLHLNENNVVTNEVGYNNEAPLNIQFQDTESVSIEFQNDGINNNLKFNANTSLITHDDPLDGYLAGAGNNAIKVISHVLNGNFFQSPTDGNVLVNDAISLVGLWDDYRDKAVLRGLVQVNTNLQSYINAGKRYLVYYGELNDSSTHINYQDCNFYTLLELQQIKSQSGEKRTIVKVGEIMSANTIYVNTDLM